MEKFCDYCSGVGVRRLATVDTKTVMGPWANLCDECENEVGIKSYSKPLRSTDKNKADQNISFEDWLSKVDDSLVSLCGLGYMDLPDMDYSSLYHDGVSPSEAADEAFENAGGF